MVHADFQIGGEGAQEVIDAIEVIAGWNNGKAAIPTTMANTRMVASDGAALGLPAGTTWTVVAKRAMAGDPFVMLRVEITNPDWTIPYGDGDYGTQGLRYARIVSAAFAEAKVVDLTIPKSLYDDCTKGLVDRVLRLPVAGSDEPEQCTPASPLIDGMVPGTENMPRWVTFTHTDAGGPGAPARVEASFTISGPEAQEVIGSLSTIQRWDGDKVPLVSAMENTRMVGMDGSDLGLPAGTTWTVHAKRWESTEPAVLLEVSITNPAWTDPTRGAEYQELVAGPAREAEALDLTTPKSFFDGCSVDLVDRVLRLPTVPVSVAVSK